MFFQLHLTSGPRLYKGYLVMVINQTIVLDDSRDQFLGTFDSLIDSKMIYNPILLINVPPRDLSMSFQI